MRQHLRCNLLFGLTCHFGHLQDVKSLTMLSLSLSLSLSFFVKTHNYIKTKLLTKHVTIKYCHPLPTWAKHVELPIDKNTSPKKEFPLAPIKKIPYNFAKYTSLRDYHQITNIVYIPITMQSPIPH